MKEVKSGIYRYWKSNLYFVQGTSNDGNEPLNDESCLVSYHPLYPVPNIGWRHRSFSEFFEEVNRPAFNYFGPRFKKILDWKEPNILPGRQFRNRIDVSHELCTIKEVIMYRTGEIIVKSIGIGGEERNFAIEEFSLQKIQLV